MNPSGGFAHHWRVTVLDRRPLILPRRRHVYPGQAEEVERGALELLVTPTPPAAQSKSGDPARPGSTPGQASADVSGTDWHHGADDPFLATCALGFADPLAPTGVWSCPNPVQICAVAGGYAYLIDTRQPERFEQIAYRPVLAIHAARNLDLLLFVGHRSILAYGEHGQAWESPQLSDEGLTITSIEGGRVDGMGWQMRTDQETPFALDLKDGRLIAASP